jgi:hypothetical protein
MPIFFCYSTLPFDELIKRASEEKHDTYILDEHEKYYLRSLGSDERKDVADIKYNIIHCPGIFIIDDMITMIISLKQERNIPSWPRTFVIRHCSVKSSFFQVSFE